MISQSFAKQYFPRQNPLGRQIRCSARALNPSQFGPTIPRTIVGIVSDVRHLERADSDAGIEMYTPEMQNTLPFSFFMVRTASDPLSLSRLVRQTVNKVLPNAPVSNLVPMETRLEAMIARPRFNTFLLGAFAIIALALAAVGTYGVAAYGVQQRVREIGIRMAMGATRVEILAMFFVQGVRPALIGLAAGIAASFALMRVMESLLYGVTTHDPVSFLLAPIVLLLCAAAASLLPALRATRVDPASVLRAD